MIDHKNPEYFFHDIAITLCGYFLANHKIKSVSLTDFDNFQEVLSDVAKLKNNINSIAKDSFSINGLNIHIYENFIETVKLHLHRQLLRIISPQEIIYSVLPVTILGNLLINEDYPPVNQKKMQTDPIYNAYVKRYVTQECYTNDTLQQIAAVIQQLLHMQIITPPHSYTYCTERFDSIINAHLPFWRDIIRKIINGTLKAHDNVVGYLYNNAPLLLGEINYPAICSSIEWLTSTNMPSLLYVKNHAIFVSTAFFENNTAILPYILLQIDFGYLPKNIEQSLLYSAMQVYKKQTIK